VAAVRGLTEGKKEAGVLLKGILEGQTSARSSGSRKGKMRKARAEAVKECPPASLPDSVSREELVATLKKVADLVNGLLVKLEGS
jgi:hypothetical protein